MTNSPKTPPSPPPDLLASNESTSNEIEPNAAQSYQEGFDTQEKESKEPLENMSTSGKDEEMRSNDVLNNAGENATSENDKTQNAASEAMQQSNEDFQAYFGDRNDTNETQPSSKQSLPPPPIQTKPSINTSDSSSNDVSSDTNSKLTKKSPPPVPDHILKKYKEEKRREDTQSGLKAAAVLAGFSLLRPPAIIGAGYLLGSTLRSEVRSRQQAEKEKGLKDRSFTDHLSDILHDTFSSGKSDKPASPTFSTKELESSVLGGDACQDMLDKYDLPPPQSDFTKACLQGDQLHLNVHWAKLKETNASTFDFSPHDYQYALHYAAIAGRAEICKQLINVGADDTITFEGKTPSELTSNVIVLDTIRAFSILKKEFDLLVGLQKVKRNIYQLANKIILDKRRAMIAQRNKSPLVQSRKLNHFVISGNPGVGKTKCASIIAKMFYALGIVQKDVFITAQRGDLCAQYVGQTAPKTRKVIKRASGGVLFIDEAYRLSQEEQGNDYGQEAIDELMQHMTDEGPSRTVFIFAGYKQPMQKFIQSNPGIFRRVDFQLNFDDYSCKELAKIALLTVTMCGYNVDNNVTVDFLEKAIEEHCPKELQTKMNGGLSEKCIQYAIQIQNDMLSLDANEDELSTLSQAHMIGALKLVSLGGDVHLLESGETPKVDPVLGETPKQDGENKEQENEGTSSNQETTDENKEERKQDQEASKHNFDDLVDDLLD